VADSACAVVVDDLTDSLAATVADHLQQRGIPVKYVASQTLALLDLNVERDHVLVGGVPLGALFFRAGPWTQFAEGFVADDASFANMEVSLAWLAIMARPAIAILNRPDAEVWTTRSEWAVWRRRLLAADVPCVDLAVGAVDGTYHHWLPWGGGIAQPPGVQVRRLFASALTNANGLTSSVWFAGRTFPESACPATLGDFLRRYGIELAGITADSHGRIAALTIQPQVDEPTARLLAPNIAERLAQRVAVAA
jgi:hypothetical protein